ncbi:MAG: hypothetical protein V3575_05160 [Candidatus Absconditabacteria bacterium]
MKISKIEENSETHCRENKKYKKDQGVVVKSIIDNLAKNLINQNFLSTIFTSFDNINKFRKLNKDNINSFEDFKEIIYSINDYINKHINNKTIIKDDKIKHKKLITIQHEILNYIVQKNLITNLDKFIFLHENIQDCEYTLFNRKLQNKNTGNGINYYIINNFENYYAQQELLNLSNGEQTVKQLKSAIRNIKNSEFELNCYFFYKKLLDLYENYLLEENGLDLLKNNTLVDESIFETLNSQGISDNGLKKIVLFNGKVCISALNILIERTNYSKKGGKTGTYLQLLNEILIKTTNNKAIEIICKYILDSHPTESGLIAIIEKQNKYSHRAGLKALEKYPKSDKVLETTIKCLPQLKDLAIKRINGTTININNNHKDLALRLAKLFMIGTQIPNLRSIIKPIAINLTNPQNTDDGILSNMIAIDKNLVGPLIGILNNKIININEYESFIKSIDNIIKTGNFSTIGKNSINKNSITIKEYVTFRDLLIEFKKSLLNNFIQSLTPNIKNIKKMFNLNNEYQDILLNWAIKNTHNIDVIEYIYKNFNKELKEIYFLKIIKNGISNKIKFDFNNFMKLYNIKLIDEKTLFERIAIDNNFNLDIQIFIINNFNEYYSGLAFNKLIKLNIGRREIIKAIHKINNAHKSYILYNSLISGGNYYNEFGHYKKYAGKLTEDESYYLLTNGSHVDEIIIENLNFESFSLNSLKKFITDIPLTSEIGLNVYLRKKISKSEIRTFNNGLYDIITLCKSPILDTAIKFIINKNPTPLGLNMIIKNHPDYALKAAKKGLRKFPHDEVLIKNIITLVPELREEGLKAVQSNSNNFEKILNEIYKHNPNITKDMLNKCDTKRLLTLINNTKFGNISFDVLMEKNPTNDILFEIINKSNNFSNIAFELLKNKENNINYIIELIKQKGEYSWSAFEFLFKKKSLTKVETNIIFEYLEYFSTKYKNYNFEITLNNEIIKYDKSFVTDFMINYLTKTKINITNIIYILESGKISTKNKVRLVEWLYVLQAKEIIRFKLSFKQLTEISLATSIPAHILRAFMKQNNINPLDYSAYYKRRKNFSNGKIIDIEIGKKLIIEFSKDKGINKKVYDLICNQGKKGKIDIKWSINNNIQENIENSNNIENKWNNVKNNQALSFQFIKELIENKTIDKSIIEKIGIEFAESKPQLNSVTIIARIIMQIPLLKKYIKNFENKKMFILQEDIEDEISTLESKSIL